MPGSPFLYWLDSGWIRSVRVFLTPKMGWLFEGWKWIGYFSGPQPKLWIRVAVAPSWVGRVTRTQNNVHVPFLNSTSVCPSPSVHVNTFGLETSAFSASQKKKTLNSHTHTLTDSQLWTKSSPWTIRISYSTQLLISLIILVTTLHSPHFHFLLYLFFKII